MSGRDADAKGRPHPMECSTISGPGRPDIAASRLGGCGVVERHKWITSLSWIVLPY
jgi:hypothetical protein